MKSVPFSEVREYYERTQPNGHWFDRSALLFFNSRLPKVAYETNAGLLFITSETNPSNETRYSVRRQDVTGTINTVGEFHSYRTRADALAVVRNLDKGV